MSRRDELYREYAAYRHTDSFDTWMVTEISRLRVQVLGLLEELAAAKAEPPRPECDAEHSVCTTCHGDGRTDVPVCPDCGYRAPRPASSLSRDELGRIVRDAWVKWARQQPGPRPSWLVPYDRLDDSDKEVDRQIGEAVAAAIVHPKPA